MHPWQAAWCWRETKPGPFKWMARCGWSSILSPRVSALPHISRAFALGGQTVRWLRRSTLTSDTISVSLSLSLSCSFTLSFSLDHKPCRARCWLINIETPTSSRLMLFIEGLKRQRWSITNHMTRSNSWTKPYKTNGNTCSMDCQM